MAANGSKINMFGVHTNQLHLRFLKYDWCFTVAVVSHPLLGSSFLWENFLLVDLKGKCQVNAETYLSISLCQTPVLDAISTSTE